MIYSVWNRLLKMWLTAREGTEAHNQSFIRRREDCSGAGGGGGGGGKIGTRKKGGGEGGED